MIQRPGTSGPARPRTPPSSSASSETNRQLTSPLPLLGLLGLPPFLKQSQEVSDMASMLEVQSERLTKESGTFWGRLRRGRHRVRHSAEAGVPAVEVAHKPGPPASRSPLPQFVPLSWPSRTWSSGPSAPVGGCPLPRPRNWSGPGTPGRPSDTSAARSANGPATPTTRSGHANDHPRATAPLEQFRKLDAIAVLTGPLFTGTPTWTGCAPGRTPVTSPPPGGWPDCWLWRAFIWAGQALEGPSAVRMPRTARHRPGTRPRVCWLAVIAVPGARAPGPPRPGPWRRAVRPRGHGG